MRIPFREESIPTLYKMKTSKIGTRKPRQTTFPSPVSFPGNFLNFSVKILGIFCDFFWENSDKKQESWRCKERFNSIRLSLSKKEIIWPGTNSVSSLPEMTEFRWHFVSKMSFWHSLNLIGSHRNRLSRFRTQSSQICWSQQHLTRWLFLANFLGIFQDFSTTFHTRT